MLPDSRGVFRVERGAKVGFSGGEAQINTTDHDQCACPEPWSVRITQPDRGAVRFLTEALISICIICCDSKHHDAQVAGSEGILVGSIRRFSGGLSGLETGAPHLMRINLIIVWQLRGS